MKTTILGILILTVLAFAGCSNRDAEATAFLSDLDKMTGEITAKINAQTTAAGVDEAQKVLDGKKSEMKSRYDKLATARGYELSSDVMKKVSEGVSKNMQAMADLQINNVEKNMSDAAFGSKMNKLYTDYNSIFGV